METRISHFSAALTLFSFPSLFLLRSFWLQQQYFIGLSHASKFVGQSFIVHTCVLNACYLPLEFCLILQTAILCCDLARLAKHYS